MVRKMLFVSLVGMVIVGLLLGLRQPGPSTVHAQGKGLDGESQQRILRATLQIKMVRENIRHTAAGMASDGEVSAKRELVVTASEGIGTLLNIEGENVILTHNHWTQLPGDVEPYRVRFYNGQGEWLWEVDSIAFERNVLYRDEGALIMRAPDELVSQLAPALDFKYCRDLTRGDTVYVVRRRPDTRTMVEIVAATVTDVNVGEPQALMILQSADGQTIEPGDSGGGIWYDGSLVGNMWMTIREEWRYPDHPEEVMVVSTDRSRAAGLTESLLALLEASLAQLGQIATHSDLFEIE